MWIWDGAMAVYFHIFLDLFNFFLEIFYHISEAFGDARSGIDLRRWRVGVFVKFVFIEFLFDVVSNVDHQ